jgi:hypothetical protein
MSISSALHSHFNLVLSFLFSLQKFKINHRILAFAGKLQSREQFFFQKITPVDIIKTSKPNIVSKSDNGF